MITAVLRTETLRFCVPNIFPLLPFSHRKMPPFLGWAFSTPPPLPMTFKALHDLAPVYLAHSPTNCRAPLACSQFL